MPNRGGKKLLVPFLIWTFVGWILYCIEIYINNDKNWIHYILTPLKELTWTGAIQGNLPLWFLPSLFLVKNLYNILTNKISKPLITLTGLCGGCLLFVLDNPTPFYVRSLVVGLYFYGMGDMLRIHQYKRITSLFACAVFIAFVIFGISHVGMKDNMLVKGNYMLWYLNALVGCITINAVMKILPVRLRILNFIGTNSMMIYVSHWLIIGILRDLRVQYPNEFGFLTSHTNTFVVLLLVELTILLTIRNCIKSKELIK